VDRILADRLCVELADRSFRGIGGVCRTHDLAVAGDGVLTFENLNHGRSGGHELAQLVEEGAALVHGIEAFSLAAAHPHALRGHDTQAGFLELGDDRAGQVAPRRIRLDHRKGALDRHGMSFNLGEKRGKLRVYSVRRGRCEAVSGGGGSAPEPAMQVEAPLEP
jgi:hypothetical protein